MAQDTTNTESAEEQINVTGGLEQSAGCMVFILVLSGILGGGIFMIKLLS